MSPIRKGAQMNNKADILLDIIKKSPEYFEKLPITEQNLFSYYVLKKMHQTDIAELLGITQGAVSSRIRRIGQRFSFMEKLKNYNTNNIEQDLSKSFGPFEIELLKGMMETTCQSETARRLNETFSLTDEPVRRKIDGKPVLNINKLKCNKMTQTKVRHQFEKCLEKMKKENQNYYDLFSLIKHNLYMLHEVKLPHFSRRTL